eukprot:5641025-Prymnesium_polylepis.1
MTCRSLPALPVRRARHACWAPHHVLHSVFANRCAGRTSAPHPLAADGSAARALASGRAAVRSLHIA